jgi:hypothetical protein
MRIRLPSATYRNKSSDDNSDDKYTGCDVYDPRHAISIPTNSRDWLTWSRSEVLKNSPGKDPKEENAYRDSQPLHPLVRFQRRLHSASTRNLIRQQLVGNMLDHVGSTVGPIIDEQAGRKIQAEHGFANVRIQIPLTECHAMSPSDGVSFV